MLRAFARTGADVFGVPVDEEGMNTAALQQVLLRHQPAAVAVTPNFQNPTGVTLSLERRHEIVRLLDRHDALLIEIDIYSALRYRGSALPPLKALAPGGQCLLLGSYSKVSFPGLRVGWCTGPRNAIARLVEAKEISDLHSDQLSQAVLLRFAQSGELAAHLKRTLASGAQKLHAALWACENFLPPGAHWTKPDGGRNLWVELPAPLTADELLEETRLQGVRFLPGRYFSARQPHLRGLRISYGALSPQEITRGIEIIGQAAVAQLAALETRYREEPAPALV
jgi:2-aminoadipate transaminase